MCTHLLSKDFFLAKVISKFNLRPISCQAKESVLWSAGSIVVPGLIIVFFQVEEGIIDWVWNEAVVKARGPFVENRRPASLWIMSKHNGAWQVCALSSPESTAAQRFDWHLSLNQWNQLTFIHRHLFLLSANVGF